MGGVPHATAHAPFCEAIEEDGVIGLEYEDEIEPSLWEEGNGVVLQQHAASAHRVLELVADLRAQGGGGTRTQRSQDSSLRVSTPVRAPCPPTPRR